MVSGPIWKCQGQSGMPEAHWNASASLGCQRQSGVPEAVSGARAHVRCVLHEVCYRVICATRCAMPCCRNVTRSALVYFNFAQWEGFEGLEISSQSGVPGPRPVWRCQGQSGVQGRVWQGQSGLPEPVWAARGSLECQYKSRVPRQSEVPKPVWGANANLGCQRQCEMPALI